MIFDWKKPALAAVLALTPLASSVTAYAETGTTLNQPGAVQPTATQSTADSNTSSTAPSTPEASLNPDASPSPASPLPDSSPAPAPASSPPAVNTYGSTASQDLVLLMNSAVMKMNGTTYQASRPLIVKGGATYVSLRSLSDRIGATITVDSRTKETVITRAGIEVRLKAGSAAYKVNGLSKKFSGAVYADKNITMVPLTAFSTALGIPYTVNNQLKQIVLSLSAKPVATFQIQSGEIVAGQTQIQYMTQSSSPKGYPIVEEKWEGKQDVFADAGTYTVRYSVRDSAGQWSDPYSVTIRVVTPNIPPIAQFTTDKDTYRMGEPIKYTDGSSDPDGTIVSTDWANNKAAFFQPGPVVVSISVKDNRGAVTNFSKTITISNEVLYTEDEFNKLFTPAGSNYPIDGNSVKTLEELPYSYTTEPMTLFRSTGPETVTQDGVLYQDTIYGDTRILLHHKNNTGKNAKLYLIARNMDSVQANLQLNADGMAGPSAYPEVAGRMSVTRYFETFASGNNSQFVSLAPGETRLLFSDISAKSMTQNDVITFMGDILSDARIQYTAVLVQENRDPIAALVNLPMLDPNLSFVRGTFPDSNRVFDYGSLVGDRPTKLSLTYPPADPFQEGYDGIKNTIATNSGNYALMYKIVLRHVAPHTLISLNPRGGLFMGAALVNGKTVGFAILGKESATNQASVLYRTGDNEETVEIWTTPAAGSNLPFVLLFTPLPATKS